VDRAADEVARLCVPRSAPMHDVNGLSLVGRRRIQWRWFRRQQGPRGGGSLAEGEVDTIGSHLVDSNWLVPVEISGPTRCRLVGVQDSFIVKDLDHTLERKMGKRGN